MGNIEIERLRHELEYKSGVEVDLKAAFTNLETDVNELQDRKWKADAKIMKLEQQLEGATMALARRERELEAADHRLRQMSAQQKNQYQHLLAAHHGHGGLCSSMLSFNQMPPPFSEKLLRNKMHLMHARERMVAAPAAPGQERNPLPPLRGPSPRVNNFAPHVAENNDAPIPLSFNVHSPPKQPRAKYGAHRRKQKNPKEHLRELNHQQVMSSNDFTPKAANNRKQKKRGGRSPTKVQGAKRVRCWRVDRGGCK